MRGSKVKKLRKMYRTWSRAAIDYRLPDGSSLIPDGARIISFRTFRKRICARQ